MPKHRFRQLPERLAGPGTWSGWQPSDLGYPLVNFCRVDGKICAAHLTQGELSKKPGARAEIARTRMEAVRSKLRIAIR